jgi:hypothetical protein
VGHDEPNGGVADRQAALDQLGPGLGRRNVERVPTARTWKDYLRLRESYDKVERPRTGWPVEGGRERRIMACATADDGVKLFYEETGAGFRLLFIHEFAGDQRSWEPQVRASSRRYRCITYNARGYPPSDVPTNQAMHGQARAVEDTVAILDHLNVSPLSTPPRAPRRAALAL